MSNWGLRQNRHNQVVIRRFEALPEGAQRVFRSGFIEFMKALKKKANKEIMRQPKGGKVYIIKNSKGRKKRHISSGPYETHANMTGALRRSISWKVHNWTQAEFGYGVSTGASNATPHYAGYVELGTRFMRPRPSIQNAVGDVKPHKYFERAIDKHLGRDIGR